MRNTLHSSSKIVSDRVNLPAFFLSALAMLAAPVQAVNYSQNPETIADVRCVIIGMDLANTVDASQRSAGMMLALYYLGRLEGRDPKFDLASLLVKALDSMKTLKFELESKRCATALAKKGQQLTTIGKGMPGRARMLP